MNFYNKSSLIDWKIIIIRFRLAFEMDEPQEQDQSYTPTIS